MNIPFHRAANNAFTTTAAAIGAGDGSILVNASVLDDLAVPFYADLGHEIVEVTSLEVNTPSSGVTTWIVARAVFGSASTYASGVPVAQRNYAEQVNELQDGINAAWRVVAATLAAGDGVIATVAQTEGQVTPGTGLSIEIGAGACVIGTRPVNIPITTLIITPPVSGTENRQVRVSNLGLVSSVVASVGAAAATGYMVLADLSVAYNATSFTAENITDRRAFV